MLKNRLILFGLLTIVASCGNETTVTKTTTTSTSQPADILLLNADTTVNPADDFFDYANGAWIKNNQIPASESSWGIAYLVRDELYKRKLDINQQAVTKKDVSGVEKQIADFWKAGMDSISIERQGLQPLQDELTKIKNAQSPAQIESVAADLHAIGVGVFYSEGVGQDDKKSDEMSYYFFQGGLGMPNRDYYFNKDARTSKVRDAYPAYVASLFRLAGSPNDTEANAKAKAVIGLETRLAKASRNIEALRDPYKNYNKMPVSQLQKLAPAINWTATMKGIGAPPIDTIIVGQPEFYVALSEIMKTENPQTLRDYMTFHLISTFSPYLSKPFVDASFNFYSTVLKGATQQRERWKRVLDAEESAIGEGLGKLFAAEYFDSKAKERYNGLVEGIREAYRKRIEKLDWMSDSTKQKAYVKLKTMKKKVGYPDKWKDFSSLKITSESFAKNMIESNRWENNYQLNKLGKPVDREEWHMTPQTYNAYYNPSNNEIVLPAGIFTVPGYRDDQLDDALVYGYAAASTIGHEITHGFDDQGRQYDENGNLKNWWTKADEQQFNARAEVLVKQFNNMVVVDSMKINGRATLGENLADLGGLLLGVDAFKESETFKKNEKISGYTPIQRFFLGYALGWLYKMREDELASRLLTDVHSPAKQRVNGPMPNIPAFYEAFNVLPNNKMYLPDSARVRLW